MDIRKSESDPRPYPFNQFRIRKNKHCLFFLNHVQSKHNLRISEALISSYVSNKIKDFLLRSQFCDLSKNLFLCSNKSMTLLAQMNSMIAKLHILKTVLFSEDNFPSQKQHKLILLTQTIKTQH